MRYFDSPTNIAKMFIIPPAIIAIFVAVAYFSIHKEDECRDGESILRLKGKTYVSLAQNEAERHLGLSGRAALKEDEGMLFVFQSKKQTSFWMKDMKFPIDIIWLNQEMKVLGIEKNIIPESFPKQFFSPSGMTYTLEVQSGFADKRNIVVGNTASVAPCATTLKAKNI